MEEHPDAPLTDEARAAQQIVEEFYGMFVRDVAKGRNATEAAVRAGFGEGRALTARPAMTARLADRRGNLAEVIAQLQKQAAG